MYFLSAYCATLTVGARDFSSAISGFLPSLCSDPLPWVPEVVSRVRPGASSAAARLDTRNEKKNEKKPLAQSALIYCTGRTLTLSLICQSNRRSQVIGHFRFSPGPLYQNEVRCSTFDMEQALEMIFHSHANKTHLHKKG